MFSPLQVKNKPRDGETEHAFILGSMDCMVANNYKYNFSYQILPSLKGDEDLLSDGVRCS
jgi:hypothetical protein